VVVVVCSIATGLCNYTSYAVNIETLSYLEREDILKRQGACALSTTETHEVQTEDNCPVRHNAFGSVQMGFINV
jgi:hypothetical protein